MHGKVAVTVKKKQNSNNNKMSRDFSSAQWEEVTSEYLQPVKVLDGAIFKDILDRALSLVKKTGNKRQPIAPIENEASNAKSLRTSLLDPVIGSSDDPDNSDDDSDDSGSVPVGEEDDSEPEGGYGNLNDGEIEYCD